ncbi:MAG: GNAT family N-acetyltransferase [Candidatus Thorarchaeota archaeon]
MKLPDGYEFGSVETDEELEELLSFHTIVHPDDDPDELRRQINKLPGFGRKLNFYIRDKAKNVIVCALNAIPSTWYYEDVPLRNLELGWVGTLKEHRRKGLFKSLYTHFDKLLQDGKYDISTIQGIPYYYRQFGYDFVIPMGRTLWLTVDQIPTIDEKTPPSFMQLNIREATSDDIDDLMKLYDEHNRPLQVYTGRNRDLWNVQEETKREYDKEFQTIVLEDENGVQGYLRFVLILSTEAGMHGSGNAIQVIESRIQSFTGVRRALQFLRTKALEHNIYRIGVSGPATNNLSRIALDLGGHIRGGWKHQIRIPSMFRLLRSIQPVLEKRLMGTMFEDLTEDLALNTFRNCYLLKFVNGKIESITDSGMQEVDENRRFRSPPDDLARLVLGAYSIDELSYNNIDFIVSNGLKSLIQTLFPKRESCIFYYMC